MKAFLFIIISLVILSPHLVSAGEILGQQISFNVESDYDLEKRSQLTASLIKISPTLYWYADNNWWVAIAPSQKEEILTNLNVLTEEFEDRIYPILTRTFGKEWNPGIDKDSRITVLLHPMKKEAGGYSNTADEYPKIQSPSSNEKEMVYLNSSAVNSSFAKIFLAHELVHLITFNQKEKILGVTEDTWLNEARAEYSSSLLGYDEKYEGSNIQQRVRDFLNNPFDSLTEWRETAADYGVVNLFTQYLVDHYGLNILTESLKTRKIGIASINEVLAKAGFQNDFSKIFLDWTVAIFINDCSFSEKYCYFNPVLKNFRTTPLMNYLPFSGNSILSINNTTKDWSGNWYKFVGGNGNLKLEFQSDQKTNFKVPFIIEDSRGNVTLSNLQFDQNFKGTIDIPDFGSKNISLTIIPVVQNKTSDFDKIEPLRSFFFSASTIKAVANIQEPKKTEEVKKTNTANTSKEVLVAELKSQILVIQIELVRLLQQLIQLYQSQLLTR